MAFIDNLRRIKVEDFPDKDRETVDRIAEYYNSFADQVTNAINGNLDYDNLRNDIKEIQVTVGSNGVPTTSTTFIGDIGMRGTKVVRADNLTNKTNYVTAQPFIIYDAKGNGEYIINKITGLVANNTYKLVFELVY